MFSLLARIVHAWVPPVLREWMLRQMAGIRRVKRWPKCTDTGWADAASVAVGGYVGGVRRTSESSIIGLDPNEDARNYSAGAKQFHDRLIQFALVAARAAQGRDALKLLDYGGGFGAHAAVLSRLLPGLTVQYSVVELPEFCRAGRAVNPSVRFVEGLAGAGSGYHLVYASSSIQYAENWRELLAELCRASVGYLFITRTPFVLDGPSFVTVQRAYGTEFPGWVLNRDEISAEIRRHGFTLKEVFLNGSDLPVRGLRKCNVHLALLFERVEDAIE